MGVTRFDKAEFRKFATLLSQVRTPKDLAIIQNRMGNDLYGIRAIVSLPIYDPSVFSYLPVALPSSLFREYIVPYFQYPNFYFIHHEQMQLPRLAIDYTITFDTNFASYVKEIVKAGSLEGQQPEIKRAFQSILYNDFNFDLFFYFLENIKIAYPIAVEARNSEYDSPLTFWKLLDKNFRWNAICLELFRSIDCRHYRKTQTLKFEYSLIKATRLAVNFVYGFYASQQGQQLISELILPLQKLILAQLLAILRIQFSSNQRARNKLKQFLDFVQDECPVFLDRETVLAYMYFKNRKDTPIMNQINKGGKHEKLWRDIDNLAWDLTAFRFMERMFTVLELGDYMIPFFFSFDKRLRYHMKAFPAKAVIIDRMSGSVLSIPEMNTKEYFEHEGCGDIVADFFSAEKTNERSAKLRKDPDAPMRIIAGEFKRLRAVLSAG